MSEPRISSDALTVVNRYAQVPLEMNNLLQINKSEKLRQIRNRYKLLKSVKLTDSEIHVLYSFMLQRFNVLNLASLYEKGFTIPEIYDYYFNNLSVAELTTLLLRMFKLRYFEFIETYFLFYLDRIIDELNNGRINDLKDNKYIILLLEVFALYIGKFEYDRIEFANLDESAVKESYERDYDFYLADFYPSNK